MTLLIGKPVEDSSVTLSEKAKEFGQSEAPSFVPGADLLDDNITGVYESNILAICFNV